MNRKQFTLLVIGLLVVFSAVFFVVQLTIFDNVHEALFLLFQDLLFLPIHILFITFIVDRMIHNRAKRSRQNQLHIVICAFFSEIGNDSIAVLNKYILGLERIKAELGVSEDWEDKDFDEAASKISRLSLKAQYHLRDAQKLQHDLPHKKRYLLEMFNNPSMLENNQFTEMLWALYHLIDEIGHIEAKNGLPSADIKHLGEDISRAYSLLLHEWIFYLKHLKNFYPYMFTTAVRKNPFADKPVTIAQK